MYALQLRLKIMRSCLAALSVLGLMGGLSCHAESLVVNSGQTITFNTTANTWSISGGGGRIRFRANILTINGSGQTVGALSGSTQVSAAGGAKGTGTDPGATDGEDGSISYVLPPPPTGTLISFF